MTEHEDREAMKAELVELYQRYEDEARAEAKESHISVAEEGLWDNAFLIAYRTLVQDHGITPDAAADAAAEGANKAVARRRGEKE